MNDEKVNRAIEKLQGIETYHLSIDFVVKAKSREDAIMKAKFGLSEQEAIRSVIVITDWE